MEYSTLGKYAFDLNDGAGWRVLPVQPTDQKILLPGDPVYRLNGTQQIPMYWDVALVFQSMSKYRFQELARMYHPGRQLIKLNMMSTVNPLEAATGALGSGWFSSDAVWTLPPIAAIGQIRGIMLYDVTLTLHRVEIDLLNNNLS